jgi:hypothetical protein
MNAIEAYGKVKASAVERRKRATRIIAAMAAGEAVRQGDVYLKRLERVPPRAARMEPPDPQLAPGTTRGSRHVITPETFAHCVLYRLPRQTALDGPVIEAREPFELSHPEHGHFILPAGVYQVRYQRTYAEELRRVQD